jgi:hypothetical protein
VSWFGGELGKVIPGSQLGYELGLFLPVELPRGWELRIGLGGALKGGEVVDSVSFEIPVGLEQTRIYVLRSRMNVNFIHLEAPVLLRAPVPGTGAWPLRWSAGLTPSVRVLEYPNFLFSGPSPPDANRFELSAVFGLGFEWRTPQTINALELRFKGGMTRVFDDFSGRNRAVLLVWSMHR